MKVTARHLCRLSDQIYCRYKDEAFAISPQILYLQHMFKRKWTMILFQDLTKWKNRRRSTKSDLRTRSQDREHVIKQMINGASTGSEQNLRRCVCCRRRGIP